MRKDSPSVTLPIHGRFASLIFVHMADTMVMQVFRCNPVDGHLFLFVNRRRDRLKVIWWDYDGWAIFYKRLEAGTYQIPLPPQGAAGLEIDATDLAMLLNGIDVTSAKSSKRYSRVA